MTPESAVKKAVRKLLDPLKPQLWYDMPVPTGRGKSTVDFLCLYRHRFFVIETKAAGEKPTTAQLRTMLDIRFAGGCIFLVTGGDPMGEELEHLSRFLDLMSKGYFADGSTHKRLDKLIDDWLQSPPLDI